MSFKPLNNPYIPQLTENNAPVKLLAGSPFFWKRNIVAVLATVLIMLALLGTSTPAKAITGGQVSSKPWVVRILGHHDYNRISSCSGAALGAELVITAGHCKADSVEFPGGHTVQVLDRHTITGVDIQLVTLERAYPLSEYAELGRNFIAEGLNYVAGAVGTVYGYGSSPYPGEQRSMTVTVKEHAPMTPWIEVFIVTWNGNDATVENGDSGGPLIIDGKLVGILKAGGRSRDELRQVVGAQYHGLSVVLDEIHALKHHREFRDVAVDESATPWISKVRVSNQRLYVDMSSQLINSGKKVAMWVNGKYAGEVFNDVSYYCDKFNYSGGATISPHTLIQDGDLIQIGIVTSINTPQASELLFETRATGVEVVMRYKDVITFRMSSALVNSGQRIIIWYNGVYAAEVYNGSIYYASVVDLPGGKNFFPNWFSVAPETLVQVGVVAGVPGTAYGTPATAKKILYEGIPKTEE